MMKQIFLDRERPNTHNWPGTAYSHPEPDDTCLVVYTLSPPQLPSSLLCFPLPSPSPFLPHTHTPLSLSAVSTHARLVCIGSLTIEHAHASARARAPSHAGGRAGWFVRSFLSSLASLRAHSFLHSLTQTLSYCSSHAHLLTYSSFQRSSRTHTFTRMRTHISSPADA